MKKAADKAERKIERRLGTNIPMFLLLCIFAAAIVYGIKLEKAGEGNAPAPVIQNFIEKDADLSVRFIDVGQGDCSLIVYKDKSVLIDAGEKDNVGAAIEQIEALGIERFDYIIATHPHSDHIGGLAEIITKFEAGKVIAPKVSDELVPTSAAYDKFLSALSKKGLRLTAAKAGDVYSLADENLENDNTSFEILAPARDDYDNLNDWSVVVKLTHVETSFLFTGDAGKPVESDILESGADISADVIKLSHHGSSTATGKKFLKAVSPSAAVIMCGDGNSYGHPHKEIIDLLNDSNIKYYRTDSCGTVTAYSDGASVRIVTEKGDNSADS